MPRRSVLKEIKPGGSFNDNMVKLICGLDADDPLAEMVWMWRYLARECKRLGEQREKLLVRLAGARPTIQSLNILPEHHDEDKERQLLAHKVNQWEANAETLLGALKKEAGRLRVFHLPHLDWEAETFLKQAGNNITSRASQALPVSLVVDPAR